MMQAMRTREVQPMLPALPPRQDQSMHRRHLMAAVMAAPAFALARSACADEAMPATDAEGWRQSEVTTRVTLPDAPRPAQLWLPLAQTAAGYQSAGALSWTTGQNSDIVRRVHDERYAAQMLRVDFGPEALATIDTPARQTRPEAASRQTPDRTPPRRS